jgi:hypothetical protein
MNMFAYGSQLGNRIRNIVREVFWVGCRESNPLEACNGIEPSEELAE